MKTTKSGHCCGIYVESEHQGLIDVKLETKSGKPTLIAVVQAVTMRHAGWNADYNQATTFGNYFLSNSSNNTAKYANPEYDKAIAGILCRNGCSRSCKAYAKAEEILAKISVSCQSLTM